MSKKYDRNTVISKLTRAGLKIKYREGSKAIHGFVCSDRKPVGIKSWGYIDFLKLPLIRKVTKNRPKKERKQFIKVAKHHYFRWFAKKEWANAWADALRNHLKTPVKIYIDFINNEYRVWAETIIN